MTLVAYTRYDKNAEPDGHGQLIKVNTDLVAWYETTNLTGVIKLVFSDGFFVLVFGTLP